jgi:hypothetical protein
MGVVLLAYGFVGGDLQGVGRVSGGEANETAERAPRTPNSLLRGIRENERHESRAEFAEAMTRTSWEMGLEIYPNAQYVQRLESGHIRWPHRTYRNILEKLCGRPARELGFAPTHRSAGDSAAVSSRSSRVNVTLREMVWESGIELTEFARKIEVHPKTLERWITRGVIPQPVHRWQTSLLLGIDESELWPDATPHHEIPASRIKVANGREKAGKEKTSEIEVRGQTIYLAPNLSQSETLPDPLRSSFANDMNDMVEAVKRREFLLGMATTVGFGTTGSMAPSFKHVDPELIPYFQQQLEGHYRADMLLGPRALISTVTAQCKLIGQLIDSADEPTRQRMAAVGTSFATFAAWLYLDAGDIAAALHWHDVAQEMAHRSRDREAVACALVDRAKARTEQGMGVAVMDLCDSALMDAGHLSPELRVFALQQKAHGASIIGDRRQVDALLDEAVRFVDQVDVEVWGVPCLRTPHYVEVHRATCYGRLGLATEALGVWQQIIPDAPSTARRDIGVWVARQATLSASLREPEWTVELARHAVKVALETGSARVRRELAAAKATMAPWQAEPVGREFAEVLAPIGEGI